MYEASQKGHYASSSLCAQCMLFGFCHCCCFLLFVCFVFFLSNIFQAGRKALSKVDAYRFNGEAAQPHCSPVGEVSS